MSKSIHGVLHVLAIAVQYTNQASSIVPAKYQPLVAGAVALAQAVLGISQHKLGA
jgi:hypothetical protein